MMRVSKSSSTWSTITLAKGTNSDRPLRGIDNASYYWLHPDNSRYYDDFHRDRKFAEAFADPRVLQMVMNSLRRWIDVYHVDGFRFDLATVGPTAKL